MEPDEHLEQFWSFIDERQRIWHRRFVEKQSKPWTKDWILQRNKFTNIYRELDPGTQFCQEHILDANVDSRAKAFNALLYRVIGRAETLALLGLTEPRAYRVADLDSRLRRIGKVSAEKLFTGAYLVHPYHWMGGPDKINNVARLFGEIAADWDSTWDALMQARNSREAFLVLRGLKGIGDFLAYQALVDCQYPFANQDKGVLPFSNDDWAKAGPGALKGLGLVFGSPKDELRKMKALRDMHVEALPEDFPFLDRGNGPEQISLANIQNCLCEYHKYAKIQDGTGQARKSYPGTAVRLDAFHAN